MKNKELMAWKCPWCKKEFKLRHLAEEHVKVCPQKPGGPDESK